MDSTTSASPVNDTGVSALNMRKCPFHHGFSQTVSTPSHASTKSEGDNFSGEKFTCPFELAGIRDGTIIETSLSEIQKVRFAQIEEAYKEFYATPKAPGMKFILPESVQEPSLFGNLHEVKAGLVEYQAELLAVEMMVRFEKVHRLASERCNMSDLPPVDYDRAVSFLSFIMAAEAIKGNSFKWSAECLHSILYEVFHDAMCRGSKSPQIFIFLPPGNIRMITIALGGIIVHPEQKKDRIKTLDNQNTFHLVKTPFYKPTFGRYATELQMWVTREADFIRVPKDSRYNIRKSANEVLIAGGISLKDPIRSVQEGGVWIPGDD